MRARAMPRFLSWMVATGGCPPILGGPVALDRGQAPATRAGRMTGGAGRMTMPVAAGRARPGGRAAAAATQPPTPPRNITYYERPPDGRSAVVWNKACAARHSRNDPAFVR